jgi:hypothetical protein
LIDLSTEVENFSQELLLVIRLHPLIDLDLSSYCWIGQDITECYSFEVKLQKQLLIHLQGDCLQARVFTTCCY